MEVIEIESPKLDSLMEEEKSISIRKEDLISEKYFQGSNETQIRNDPIHLSFEPSSTIGEMLSKYTYFY